MNQERVPRGVSAGGQYTQPPRTEAKVSLSTDADAATAPAERISAVAGRGIVSPPRRGVALTPEETEQLLARVHPVDPEQMWPRRRAIREAAERDAAMNEAKR